MSGYDDGLHNGWGMGTGGWGQGDEMEIGSLRGFQLSLSELCRDIRDVRQQSVRVSYAGVGSVLCSFSWAE